MNKLEEISLLTRRAKRTDDKVSLTHYETSLLLDVANVAFEVYQGLDHSAINADEAQTKLGDALEPLIWGMGNS